MAAMRERYTTERFFSAAAQAGVLAPPPPGSDGRPTNPFKGAKSTYDALDTLAQARAAAIADPLRNTCAYFAALVGLIGDDLETEAPTLGSGNTRSVVGETALVALVLTAQYESIHNASWNMVATPLLVFMHMARGAFGESRLPLLDSRVRDAGIVGGWQALEASIRLIRILATPVPTGDYKTRLALAEALETLGRGPLQNPKPCVRLANAWRQEAIETTLAATNLDKKLRFALLMAKGDSLAARKWVYDARDNDLDDYVTRLPESYDPMHLLCATDGMRTDQLADVSIDKVLYEQMMQPPGPEARRAPTVSRPSSAKPTTAPAAAVGGAGQFLRPSSTKTTGF